MIVDRSAQPEAAVEAGFLELVCEDEALLRAEFDEIVARAYDGPHPPPEPVLALPDTARPGTGGSRMSGQTVALAVRPHHPGSDGWARERGPPPRDGRA